MSPSIDGVGGLAGAVWRSARIECMDVHNTNSLMWALQ